MSLLDAFGTGYLAGGPMPPYRPHPFFRVPATAVRPHRTARRLVRLTPSRWEGARIDVPMQYVSIAEKTATVMVPLGQLVRLSDGRYDEYITGSDLHADRRNPPEAPGERYEVAPVWHEEYPSQMILAVGDVAAVDLFDRRRIMLRCSRWEGLHVDVPTSWCTRLSADEVRVDIDPGVRELKVRGGDRVIVVPSRELWEDRLHPLPEPGPCLATPPWLTLYVSGNHLRPLTTRRGRRYRLLFPRDHGTYPRAAVWFSPKLVYTDDSGIRRVRLRQDMTVRLYPDGGDVQEMPAPQLIELVKPWGALWSLPVRGVAVTPPAPIAPVKNVSIPDELLDT